MIASATKADLQSILSMRALFLEEANHQVRYNAVHERGWSNSYLLVLNGVTVGYGAIKGKDDLAARDAVFECYIMPPFRRHASMLFRALLEASGVLSIECQSNDAFLAALLFEHATGIWADVFLFEDHAQTSHVVPGVTVRPRRDDDQIFAHAAEPVGDYVAVLEGEVVATGGFLLHYNVPFADLYMEVREDRRRRGIGSLLIQEVKRACYLAGRVPAARTGLDNAASRATLERAGMCLCGFMLSGRVKVAQ